MKIISPSFEILTPLDGQAILKHIELCGRVCYKSEDKITDTSAAAFVAGIIKRGHEAVLEHYDITVKFICDRGVSHELVRHRLAPTVKKAPATATTPKTDLRRNHCHLALFSVKREHRHAALGVGLPPGGGVLFQHAHLCCTPQEARSVLPNSLKTEVVMTANLREWRHFFKLRTAPAAHPQMRELAIPLLRRMQEMVPVVFDDLEVAHEKS